MDKISLCNTLYQYKILAIVFFGCHSKQKRVALWVVAFGVMDRISQRHIKAIAVFA